MVYSCGLHNSLFHHPPYRSSTSRLESLLARGFCSVLYSNQCFYSTNAPCSSTMVRYLWIPFGHGFPLVLYRSCSRACCIRLCLLLLPCSVGCISENHVKYKSLTGKGRLLTQDSFWINTTFWIQQIVLSTLSSATPKMTWRLRVLAQRSWGMRQQIFESPREVAYFEDWGSNVYFMLCHSQLGFFQGCFYHYPQ